MDKYYEYIENRFGYFKKYTYEKLLKEKEELEEELYDIETREHPSQGKTDRINDEFFAKAKLRYINNILESIEKEGRRRIK